MSEVIITIGIPASGKTTWAREYARENKNVVITSRDDIRNAYGWQSGFDENRVTRIQRSQIEAALLDGMDVIVADTNINQKFRRQLIKFCHEHGADVMLMPFPISLDEAILRDSLRQTHKVGADVITRFYNDLKSQNIDWDIEVVPAPRFAPYTRDPNSKFDSSKREAIVIDIDGTIAEKGNRNPFDESRVGQDSPIRDVIDVTNSLTEFYYPIFVSGRTDSCEVDTRIWLRYNYAFLNDDSEYLLFMRRTGDTRPDYIVKNEIWDEFVIPNFHVVMAFDDRDQVVRHIRARGITVAQVAPGRF